MIRIPTPAAMVLNSHDVPPPWYKMTNTRHVAKDVTPRDLLDNVASVLKDLKAKFGMATTLIINCHGSSAPPGLCIGTGITKPDVVHFQRIAPYVNDIIIVACQAARADAKQKFDGVALMSLIAKTANATVTAGMEIQSGSATDPDWMPAGYIDDWEGPVMSFNNKGEVKDIQVNGKTLF